MINYDQFGKGNEQRINFNNMFFLNNMHPSYPAIWKNVFHNVNFISLIRVNSHSHTPFETEKKRIFLMRFCLNTFNSDAWFTHERLRIKIDSMSMVSSPNIEL